jgi:hypothetical protein
MRRHRHHAPAEAPDPTQNAACLRCDGPLDLHQPDPDRSSRILGVCPQCGDWHFVQLQGRSTRPRVTPLPLPLGQTQSRANPLDLAFPRNALGA